MIYGCTDLQASFCQAPRSAALVRMHIMTDRSRHGAGLACHQYCVLHTQGTPVKAFQTESPIWLSLVSFFPPSSAATATIRLSSHWQSSDLQYPAFPFECIFPISSFKVSPFFSASCMRPIWCKLKCGVTEQSNSSAVNRLKRPSLSVVPQCIGDG